MPLDVTLLTAITELSIKLAIGTVQTVKKLTQILNYVATSPEAIIRFYASSMQLATESDSLYPSFCIEITIKGSKIILPHHHPRN
jgi:hypothetical protein